MVAVALSILVMPLIFASVAAIAIDGIKRLRHG
jgi:hypothetical protein